MHIKCDKSTSSNVYLLLCCAINCCGLHLRATVDISTLQLTFLNCCFYCAVTHDKIRTKIIQWVTYLGFIFVFLLGLWGLAYAELWANESWVSCGSWRATLLYWCWQGACSTAAAPGQALPDMPNFKWQSKMYSYKVESSPFIMQLIQGIKCSGQIILFVIQQKCPN